MSADPIAAHAAALGYVVHRADKIGEAPDGEIVTSALCFDTPRPIDMRKGSGQTWTIADAETTCPECKARIEAMGGRDRPGEAQWRAS